MANYGEEIQAATAAQIKAEIAAIDWKQTDLALKAGIPTSTLGRYLKGERDIPFPAFVNIAAALNMSYIELATRAQRRLDGKDAR